VISIRISLFFLQKRIKEVTKGLLYLSFLFIEVYLSRKWGEEKTKEKTKKKTTTSTVPVVISLLCRLKEGKRSRFSFL
jgi:hypothetical protein